MTHRHPRKTHKSPFSRLQNTTPMKDLSKNTGKESTESEVRLWIQVQPGLQGRPRILVIEVVNSRISQETLNFFLGDAFRRENHRRTVFRNHNREIHSRLMEHYIVTQFAISWGFTMIQKLFLISQWWHHSMSLMKPLLSLANHSFNCQNRAQDLVRKLISRKGMLQRR